jgi:hypothetical protein
VAVTVSALACRSKVSDTTPWSRCSVSPNPASCSTRSIGRFSARTSAANVETPDRADHAASCSSSAVAMPTPCSFSSTKNATSAALFSPAASTLLAVATPTSRSDRTATKDHTPGPGSATRSVNWPIEARLCEKNRR